MAALAARLLPGLRQGTSSIAGKLSRDLAHLASLADPELVHHRISARLFHALQKAGADALERANQFSYPLLLLHGARDEVTSAAATREFFEGAASVDKEFILYPALLHETHNDLGRERVLDDCARWLAARTTSDPPKTTEA